MDAGKEAAYVDGLNNVPIVIDMLDCPNVDEDVADILIIGGIILEMVHVIANCGLIHVIKVEFSLNLIAESNCTLI